MNSARKVGGQSLLGVYSPPRVASGDRKDCIGARVSRRCAAKTWEEYDENWTKAEASKKIEELQQKTGCGKPYRKPLMMHALACAKAGTRKACRLRFSLWRTSRL
jgi:hypothetical protein